MRMLTPSSFDRTVVASAPDDGRWRSAITSANASGWYSSDCDVTVAVIVVAPAPTPVVAAPTPVVAAPAPVPPAPPPKAEPAAPVLAPAAVLSVVTTVHPAPAPVATPKPAPARPSGLTARSVFRPASGAYDFSKRLAESLAVAETASS